MTNDTDKHQNIICQKTHIGLMLISDKLVYQNSVLIRETTKMQLTVNLKLWRFPGIFKIAVILAL